MKFFPSTLMDGLSRDWSILINCRVPPPSFFTEEYDSNGEFESEQELFSLEYLNKIPGDIDSDGFDNFEENKRNDYEPFEKEEIINPLEDIKLTPCVVVDFVKNKI